MPGSRPRRPDHGDVGPTQSVGDATFPIGELAAEFGVSQRTLRFYEVRGFLSAERGGPARRYSERDRNRLALVLRAKRLGFTLREIAQLIAAGDQSAGGLQLSRRTCTEQIELLERQKREIEAALAELRRVYSSHYLRELGDRTAEDGDRDIPAA